MADRLKTQHRAISNEIQEEYQDRIEVKDEAWEYSIDCKDDLIFIKSVIAKNGSIRIEEL
jgi:hypothetical protein